MKIAYITHSLVSCWNHGNAHFQRGVLGALAALGHTVLACEQAGGWSRTQLEQESPEEAAAAARAQPVPVVTFDSPETLAAAIDGADLIIVHEWNDPALVAFLGTLRTAGATLLFHDTHHRAVSDPAAMRRFDLTRYDGVLAFGATLAEIYRRWGWGDRVFIWHEAADTTRFAPPQADLPRQGAVWIGNWGDGERATEIEEFLLAPCEHAGITLDIHGVRYPDPALDVLRRHGARYRGWLPNVRVPAVFARHEFTVHVPRRFYVAALPGIPTIRVFEALACGIPLLSAPWHDSEHLFRVGDDFLMVRNGQEMARAMRMLRHDPAAARALAESGLATIRARHTCRHRAEELLAIAARLRGAREAA